MAEIARQITFLPTPAREKEIWDIIFKQMDAKKFSPKGCKGANILDHLLHIE